MTDKKHERVWARTQISEKRGEGTGALLIIRVRLQDDTNRGERRGKLRCRDYMQKYDRCQREKLVADRLSRGLYHTGNKRESERDRRK